MIIRTGSAISAVGINNISVAAKDGAAPANTATVSRQVLYYTGSSSLFGDGLPDAWKIAHGLDPFSNTGATVQPVIRAETGFPI